MRSSADNVAEPDPDLASEPVDASVDAASTPWSLTAKLTTGLVALVLVVAAVLGWLIYSTGAAQSAENARGEATAAAVEQVTNMFGYHHATVEDEMDTALEGLTGDFRDTFEDEVETNVIPRAEQNEVVSEAAVVAQGPVETTKDTATVLVYFNQTITANTGPKSTFTPSRLLVELREIDGRWLVSGLESV